MNKYTIQLGFLEGAHKETICFYDYQDESEETAEVDYGSSKGFHSTNHDRMNLIKIGHGDAHIIEGDRNLLSHLEKIVTRIKAGLIDPFSITVLKVVKEFPKEKAGR